MFWPGTALIVIRMYCAWTALTNANCSAAYGLGAGVIDVKVPAFVTPEAKVTSSEASSVNVTPADDPALQKTALLSRIDDPKFR